MKGGNGLTNIVREVEAWEKQLKNTKISRCMEMYDKVLDNLLQKVDRETRKKFYKSADNVLFFSHAFLQATSIQKDARKQIVDTAKLFNPDISSIQDVNKLNLEKRSYIAMQIISREKVYSLFQGSLTGSKGTLVATIDLPTVFLLHLRAVQLIALSFGHEINKPYELMIALKIFHASNLPTHYQRESWDSLVKELYSKSPYNYEGEEDIFNDTSLRPINRQILKHLAIFLAKKRFATKVPIFSISLGAIANYYSLNKVTEYALRFYQKRYLIEYRKK